MYICLLMRSFGKKITAWLLLLAFVFAITPKEFIHAFSGHEDTVDHHTDGSITIGSYHTHCQVLQLQVNPFKETDKTILPVIEASGTQENFPAPAVHDFITAAYTALRGPPSLG